MRWHTSYIAGPKIPDGRAAHVLVSPAGDGDLAYVTFMIEKRLIKPAMLRGLGVLSAAIADSEIFDFQPDHIGQPPELTAWIERVPAEALPRGRIIAPRAGFNDGMPPSIEVMCREDLIRPEVVRELNESCLSLICGLLVPQVSLLAHGG